MKTNKFVKSIKVDGYKFSFYSFKYGILYSIDGVNQYPYYFNNMRDALNFAYEYGENRRVLGI